MEKKQAIASLGIKNFGLLIGNLLEVMMANVLLGIHCVMPGCTSTQRRVNQWKTKPCGKPKHKGKTHAQCMCPEPYQFFKFPQEVKLQKMWLDRVKRPDLEVNNLTRVS